MSRQSRAFGLSCALHAAALLVLFGLSDATEQARPPRIIDLSVLLPSGGEIAPLPERPPAPVKPPPQPRPAPPREVAPSPPPPAATSPAALPPPAEAAEEPTPVQEREEEDAAAADLGQATQGLARELPAAVASPGTSSATVPPEGAGSARPETTAVIPSAAPSGGSGERGDAGTPRDVAALRAIIKQHLVYPGVARRMGWEGKVMLSFVICGNGRARDVTLLESSGRELLDRHAQETVLKISSFPASAAEAKVIVPVVYRLD